MAGLQASQTLVFSQFSDSFGTMYGRCHSRLLPAGKRFLLASNLSRVSIAALQAVGRQFDQEQAQVLQNVFQGDTSARSYINPSKSYEMYEQSAAGEENFDSAGKKAVGAFSDLEFVPLSEKIRPTKFEDFKTLGQDLTLLINYVKQRLQSQSRRNLPPAVLLEGPQGLGQIAAAKWLDAALNCKEEGVRERMGEPCGTCESCRNVLYASSGQCEAGAAYTVTTVDWASVDERDRKDVIARLKKASASSTEVFVLMAEKKSQLPREVGARCRVVKFKSLPDATRIVQALQWIVESEGLEVAAEKGMRGDGVLDRIVKWPGETPSLSRALERLEELVNQGVPITHELIDEYVQDSVELESMGAPPPPALAQNLRRGQGQGGTSWIGVFLPFEIDEAVLVKFRQWLPGLIQMFMDDRAVATELVQVVDSRSFMRLGSGSHGGNVTGIGLDVTEAHSRKANAALASTSRQENGCSAAVVDVDKDVSGAVEEGKGGLGLVQAANESFLGPRDEALGNPDSTTTEDVDQESRAASSNESVADPPESMAPFDPSSEAGVGKNSNDAVDEAVKKGSSEAADTRHEDSSGGGGKNYAFSEDELDELKSKVLLALQTANHQMLLKGCGTFKAVFENRVDLEVTARHVFRAEKPMFRRKVEAALRGILQRPLELRVFSGPADPIASSGPATEETDENSQASDGTDSPSNQSTPNPANSPASDGPPATSKSKSLPVRRSRQVANPGNINEQPAASSGGKTGEATPGQQQGALSNLGWGRKKSPSRESQQIIPESIAASAANSGVQLELMPGGDWEETAQPNMARSSWGSGETPIAATSSTTPGRRDQSGAGKPGQTFDSDDEELGGAPWEGEVDAKAEVDNLPGKGDMGGQLLDQDLPLDLTWQQVYQGDVVRQAPASTSSSASKAPTPSEAIKILAQKFNAVVVRNPMSAAKR